MRKTFLRMISVAMLMLLLAALLPVGATAGYYVQTEAEIPVGGTGTFYIKNAGENDEDALDRLEAEGTGSFTLSFREPGTYIYEVFSEDESNPCRYEVYVYVTTDEENDPSTLHTQVAIYEEGCDRKLPAAYYPITFIDPPVRKRITGDTPPENFSFSFTFKAVSTTAEEYQGNLPMPEGADGQSMTIEVVGAAEEEIGVIVFDRAGTYVYEVREDKGSNGAYTYDKSVYRIEVDVVEGENTLETIRRIYKDGVEIEATSFEFTNRYTRPLTPKTGDENNVALYIMLMAATFLAAGMAGFILLRKNRKGAEQ